MFVVRLRSKNVRFLYTTYDISCLVSVFIFSSLQLYEIFLPGKLPNLSSHKTTWTTYSFWPHRRRATFRWTSSSWIPVFRSFISTDPSFFLLNLVLPSLFVLSRVGTSRLWLLIDVLWQRRVEDDVDCVSRSCLQSTSDPFSSRRPRRSVLALTVLIVGLVSWQHTYISVLLLTLNRSWGVHNFRSVRREIRGPGKFYP